MIFLKLGIHSVSKAVERLSRPPGRLRVFLRLSENHIGIILQNTYLLDIDAGVKFNHLLLRLYLITFDYI